VQMELFLLTEDEVLVKRTKPERTKPKQKELKKGRTRLIWARVEVETRDRKKEYPVFTPDNYRDIMLCRLLLLYTPFAGGYGKKGPAWDRIIDDCNQSFIPKTDVKVFPEGAVTKKMVEAHFKELVRFEKRLEAGNPIQSGTDDEESPCELQLALENLRELHDEVKEFESDKKATTLGERNRERLTAEALEEEC